MNKKTRAILSIMFAAAMLLTFLPSTAAAAPKVGDTLGDVLYSDITAYINGNAIPTSIKAGTTMVVVEDLANYGFDVKWDGTAKTLKVEQNPNKMIKPMAVTKDTVNKPGTFKTKYVYTDIKTYLSGQLVESFAINGVTLIDFELLSKYGKLSWNGQTREIRLDTAPSALTLKDFSVYSEIKEIRVVIDGKVNKVKGFRAGNDYWFTAPTVESLLKTTATGTSINLNDTLYYRMNETAEKLGLSSCENDTVLDAVYIWTDLDTGYSEIDRAEEFGFGKPSGEAITFSNFMTMLDKMVEIADKSKLAEWKVRLPEARKSDKKMNRAEGALALFYAVETLGGEYLRFNVDWTVTSDIQKDTWDDFKVDLEIFPNNYDKLSPKIDIKGPESDSSFEVEYRFVGAWFYAIGRKSLSSSNGELIFGYDSKNNSMHYKDALTIEAAVLACTRMIDSVPIEEKKVALSEAGKYNKTIITDKLLKNAAQMPEPTTKSLPYSTGFVMHNIDQYWKSATTADMENYVRTTSEWGFNYLKVMTDYELFFNHDVTEIDVNQIEKLDMLISYALKYRVHIELNMTVPGTLADLEIENINGVPQWVYKGEGAYLDYYVNKQKQAQAIKIWTVLAKRYKGIPNSVLSFTVNTSISPNSENSKNVGMLSPDYTEKDVYNVIMGNINAVRKEDNIRLMRFSPLNTDSDDVGVTYGPSVYMKDAGVVLGFGYGVPGIGWGEFFEGADLLFSSGYITNKWPITSYNISARIDAYSKLTIDGVLKSGTKIDIYPDSDWDSSASVKITITNEAGEIYSQNINRNNLKTVSFTLKQDEKSISINCPDGDWFHWKKIDVTLPEKYAVEKAWFSGAANGGPNAVTRVEKISLITIRPNGNGNKVTIHEDCSYSSDSIYQIYDKNLIREDLNYYKKMLEDNGAVGYNQETGLDIITIHHKDVLSCLEDYYSVHKELNIGWVYYSAVDWFFYANCFDVDYVPYRGHQLDVELLKVLQKYQ